MIVFLQKVRCPESNIDKEHLELKRQIARRRAAEQSARTPLHIQKLEIPVLEYKIKMLKYIMMQM